MKSKKSKAARRKISRKKRQQQKPVRQSVASSAKRILACLLTGEIFQPIRLHYRVADTGRLENAFARLRCMDYDSKLTRWVWLYFAEAAELQFKKRPDTDAPIVIGEFLLKGSNEAVLNVRSVERAIKAILFFDRYIARHVVKLTHITIINKLFSVEEIASIERLDQLFERTDTTVRRPEEITEKLREIKAGAENELERLAGLNQLLTELASEPEPEIEKFPAHYYEDGIESLDLALRQRQFVALEHWKGNKNYTTMDIIQELIAKTKRG
jgi:hypothetical protein